MTQPVLDYITRDAKSALERLLAFLTIPSVSTDPAQAGEVRRAAEWVAATLQELGFEVAIYPTKGHPAVVAHLPASERVAGKPHILFYGHYDVQPVDPLNLWTTPPFQPTVRDGKIYARGASDDKGQVACFFEAIRAWRNSNGAPGNGKLPCNVSLLIEGEEEIGSPNLRPLLEAHRDELRADVVVISDTGMWHDKTPAITYGLRGLLYFDVQLHGPARDLHSGIYGGMLANPATELVAVLGRLFDANKHIAIPGFYDDVEVLTEEERHRIAALPFDEKAALKEVGVDHPTGEKGFTTLERRIARPSCDINGLYGGFGGHGSKTIIPSFAAAKVSFRLAPHQSASRVAALFEEWLRSHDVHGCRWKVTNHSHADPVVVRTDSPYMAAAQRAIQAATGRQPYLIREGATIPVVSDFKKLLGLDSLLIGFGLSDDCVHSPNEKFDIECFTIGCRTHAMLLGEMARL